MEVASAVSGNQSKDLFGPHRDDLGHSKTALCGRAERKTNLSHRELLVEEAVVAAGLNVVRLVDLRARGGSATRQRWPASMRILGQADAPGQVCGHIRVTIRYTVCGQIRYTVRPGAFAIIRHPSSNSLRNPEVCDSQRVEFVTSSFDPEPSRAVVTPV